MKIYAVVLLVLGVFRAVLWLVREPSYNGTTLSEWLEERRSGNPEAADAVRHIGPRALPTLLQLLQQRQPKWKVKANEWMEAIGLSRRFAFEDRTASAQDDALWGLQILGPAADPAIPGLVRMLNNDPPMALLSAEALIAIGSQTLPYLADALTNRNDQVRLQTIWALRFQSNYAGLSERVSMLRGDTNENVAATAVYWMIEHGREGMRGQVASEALRDGRETLLFVGWTGMRQMGPAWTNTLPILMQLTNDPDQMVRSRLTNLLRKLDPVVAAAIGINTNMPLSEMPRRKFPID